MFTGIVEEIGKIKNLELRNSILKITIASKIVAKDLKKGDSVAVNGACLTVVDVKRDFFSAEVVPETISKTNLGFLKISDVVNLERALRLSDRLSGNIVTGHIDAVCSVKKIIKGNNWEIVLPIPKEFLKFCVNKGSICVNGVSLTIAKIENSQIVISIIPYTLQNTNLNLLKTSDKVNVEFDLFGKYIISHLENIIPAQSFTSRNILSSFMDFTENGDIACN